MAQTCTWNPADIGPNVTLSNNNLTWTSHNSGSVCGRGTVGYLAGGSGINAPLFKYYETTILAGGAPSTSGCEVGIANSLEPTANFLGQTSLSMGIETTSGYAVWVGTLFTFCFTATNAQTIGTAVDFQNQKVWFTKDGATWNGDILANQNPATNMGGVNTVYVFRALAAPDYFTVYPAFGSRSSGPSGTANFGATPFLFPIPDGFSPWVAYDQTIMMFLLSP